MRMDVCMQNVNCKTCKDNYMCNGKVSKYKNKKVEYKGMTFDSKKEWLRYLVLKQLEKEGKISNLQRQVRYELQASFKLNGKNYKAINYISDFTYFDVQKNKNIVEDVKGSKATMTPVYMLKKKMFLYKHGKNYEFKEFI